MTRVWRVVRAVIPLAFVGVFFAWPVAAIIGRSLTAGALRSVIDDAGLRHVAWFTVDILEPGSRGQLQSGFGWVQFCITTEEDLSAIRMQWSKVVTNH